LDHLAFFDLVRGDLEQVESLLRERPSGQHEAIGAAIGQLTDGGGKRLRPALTLLSARLCGADIERTIFAAAAVEMLHTATLVHDDLIDGSPVRRGVGTLNARWPPGATVLAGDYIFAHAAGLVSRADSLRLMQRFAETLMIICNGEIHQMFDGRCDRCDREEYERRIYAKTASLIALSVEAGAILAEADAETRQALHSYGERLGLAFQVVDDVLDFVADEGALGKPVGSDLQQGLVTLPVLLFLEKEPDHPALRRALAENPSAGAVQEAVRVVAGSSAIQQALEVARGYAGRAKASLDGIPAGPYRAALLDVADFAVRRRF